MGGRGTYAIGNNVKYQYKTVGKNRRRQGAKRTGKYTRFTY